MHTKTVRRSVALPVQLVQQVKALAPPELRNNLNGLITAALREFAERRSREDFDRQMVEMAADPEIRRECERICEEFKGTEMDGLAGASLRSAAARSRK